MRLAPDGRGSGGRAAAHDGSLTLAEQHASTSYRELVERSSVPPNPPSACKPEEELDSLIATLQARQKHGGDESGALTPDPIQWLREMTIKEFVPIFVELAEKYSHSGISMQMDASSLLQGGREIKFEFGIQEYRTQLHGIATTEAIAFHETRHSPDVSGELVSGPMLRLRGLTGEVFRDFICERLTIMLRGAMRRH